VLGWPVSSNATYEVLDRELPDSVLRSGRFGIESF
jgi:hypothetical protein